MTTKYIAIETLKPVKSKLYWWDQTNSKYVIFSGEPIVINDYEWLDLHLTKNTSGRDCFEVTCGINGACVGDGGLTKDEAIINAKNKLIEKGKTTVINALLESINHCGLSPRYTEEPDKEDLEQAAPELYEALKQAKSFLQGYTIISKEADIYKQIDSALAKANGQP